MNRKKRKALEGAGHQIGDFGEFLGLTDEERALVELRAAVSATVQERRRKGNLTQEQLAGLLNSSQSRVAKIEAGSNDVSLDLMFRSLFAVGGKFSDVLKNMAANRRRRTIAKKRNRTVPTGH
jgi:DNA-binding XRE family transcriptional regulator